MNRFAQLHKETTEQGLPCLLIGGHAAGLHGYGRTTEDVDLLISADEEVAWHKVASAVGYRLFRDGGNFSQWQAPDDQTDDLDFMIVNAGTFEKLAGQSVTTRLLGLELKIPKSRTFSRSQVSRPTRRFGYSVVERHV